MEKITRLVNLLTELDELLLLTKKLEPADFVVRKHVPISRILGFHRSMTKTRTQKSTRSRDPLEVIDTLESFRSLLKSKLSDDFSVSLPLAVELTNWDKSCGKIMQRMSSRVAGAQLQELEKDYAALKGRGMEFLEKRRRVSDTAKIPFFVVPAIHKRIREMSETIEYLKKEKDRKRNFLSNSGVVVTPFRILAYRGRWTGSEGLPKVPSPATASGSSGVGRLSLTQMREERSQME